MQGVGEGSPSLSCPPKNLSALDDGEGEGGNRYIQLIKVSYKMIYLNKLNIRF